MFTNSDASQAMTQPIHTGAVPSAPNAHPDWYPSTMDRPSVHREPEPIKLQRRNRRSGGATGCLAFTPKPQKPSTGGAVFSKEAISA